MNEPLDEQYIKWLYSQVASIRFRNPARTYWSLIRQLFCKEFFWFVPNDDNRVEDGRDLRYEFIHEKNITADDEWFDVGCSMLELLIGLSRRLSFEAEGESRRWFWILMENLGLLHFTDAYYDEGKFTLVDEILEDIIHRTYDSDGSGGLFPLKEPLEDQRSVELWHQLNSYLLERG